MCLIDSSENRLTENCKLSGYSMQANINGRSQIILTTDVDSELMDSIQRVLSTYLYPYSRRTRYYALAFVFVWILGCDFLILVYGIQFDLKELFGFTDDVQHAVDDASAICPTDFYTWMDYFWKIQFDEQLTEIKRKAHESEGTLAEFLGEGANGSQLWLMTVVTSLLLSWFLWAPLGQFAKAVYNILYWEPYVAHDAQTLYEEAFEKDHHMVKIEPNDLIFQPYTVLKAQKMLNEAHSRIGRSQDTERMQASYNEQKSLVASLTCY